ncbi:uncharacterized protein LOC130675093 [Microplitis mediator]|uniref:uncharacterized protein LOC130675093 n=1 Tax=Microplitis mediator TaxID=375433 RepID=UPI00255665EE|nr:uncharacterized protein LOC130675093 [Microplitis mediator]
MNEYQPRDDYKELLELILIFLEDESSVNIKFKAPGATHHARWLAKAIYCLKLFLFKQQFKISAIQVSQLRVICLFIVKIYAISWYSYPNPLKAPYQDLQFLQQLVKFKSINPKVSQVATKKFTGHLWYLSEELASLSFFDDSISLETKLKMVQAIKNKESLADNKRIKISEKDLDLICDREMSDFITKKSTTLFQQFELPMDFLDLTPSEWQNDPNYIHCLEILRTIKVVNDIAERGVALIKEFNEFATKDEEQKQYLLRIVHEHRKLYPSSNKNNYLD